MTMICLTTSTASIRLNIACLKVNILLKSSLTIRGHCNSGPRPTVDWKKIVRVLLILTAYMYTERIGLQSV